MKIFDFLTQKKARPHQFERIIWEEKYASDSTKWQQACRDAAQARKELIKKETGVGMDIAFDCYQDTCDAAKLTTGIEQKIGSAAVPLGVSSPLKINGEYAKGDYYMPLATNEAALVAGLNRGRKATNMSGGITTSITRDWMTRSPLIEASSLKQAREISEEIKKKYDLYEDMKRAAERGSKVSKLLDIQPFQLGRKIYLRFYYHTGDSMGMNSATKYSSSAVKVLLEKYKDAKLITLSGNMCSDKKAAHINVLLGRGKSVEAEVLIPEDILKSVLGVSPRSVEKLCYAKNYEGSGLSGTVTGFNLNAANTVAAMFIATGQDAAQVVESSSCFTRAEVSDGGLLFGVTLPNLEVATVGGGTGYGTAKECLELLGCYGPGKTPGSNSRKLAEIIAAAVLCQELNLACVQAHGHELADSHVELARGKS